MSETPTPSSPSGSFQAPAIVPMPWRRRAEAWVRGPVQALVWVCFGVAGVWLGGRAPGAGPVRGLVRAPEAEVRAARDGRLVDVLVAEGDAVEAGAVVGRLDAAEHESLLALARSEAAVLAAELEAAVAEEALFALERDAAAEERRIDLSLAEGRATLDVATNQLRHADLGARLASEARDLRLAVAESELGLATARVDLERLRQQEARAARLASAGVDRRATAEDLALERAALEAEVASREAQRDTAQRALDEAAEAGAAVAGLAAPVATTLTASATLAASLTDAAAAAGRARIRALERALVEAEATATRLAADRASYDLIAPIAGRVVALLATPGTALVAGTPAMLVRSDVPRDVVVYLDERSFNERPIELALSRAADPTHGARARVVRMGPGVEELPLPLWRLPTHPEYGRPVVVELPAGLELLPGERVRASIVRSAVAR